MASNSDFERLVRLCESQLTRRKLGPAIQTSKVLVQNHPGEPKSWHLRHQLVCMSNKEGGAANGGSAQIIHQARQTLGERYTRQLHGDMLRDRGLGLTIFGTRSQLHSITTLLDEIRTAHQGDANREAAALDLEARWYFARGNAQAAITLHEQALALWESIGDKADQGWVSNCKVRLLRAMVKCYGRGDRRAYKLARDLANEHPAKAKQATILTSICGLWIFDFALKHR